MTAVRLSRARYTLTVLVLLMVSKGCLGIRYGSQSKSRAVEEGQNLRTSRKGKQKSSSGKEDVNRRLGRRRGRGGKGGKGGSSAGWTDNGYYGCLALSSDQQQYLDSSGSVPSCDYVVHDSSNTTRADTASSSETETSNSEASASGSNGGEGEEVERNSDSAYSSGNDATENADNNANDADGENGKNEDQSASYNADEDQGDEGNNGNNGGNGNDGGNNQEQGNDGSNEAVQYNDGNSGNSAGQDSDEVVSNMYADVNPYAAFNITQCDTYEHLWTWDVKLSCGNSTNDECGCVFADELVDMGLLSCDDAQKCPSGCPICNSCMRQLGCPNVPAESVLAAAANNASTLTAAALVTLLIGAGYCVGCKDRKSGKSDLKDHLMEDGQQGNVWMVPIESGLPAEKGQSQQAVWLVPEEDSTLGSESSTATSQSDGDDSSPMNRTKNAAIRVRQPVRNGGQDEGQLAQFPDLLAPGQSKEGRSGAPNESLRAAQPSARNDVSRNSGAGVWLAPMPKREANVSETISDSRDLSKPSFDDSETDSEDHTSTSSLTNSYPCEEGSI